MFLIKEKRIEKGLSQQQLARRSGVSQQAISKIEAGMHPNAGILTLEALARGMGCKLTDIYQPDEPAA